MRASLRIGCALVVGFTWATTALGEDDEDLRERAARIHGEDIVVDGHNDIPTFILDFGFDLGMDGADPHKRGAMLHWIPVLRWFLRGVSGDELHTDTDLRRLRAGGVDAQFFSIFVDSSYVPEDPSGSGQARQRALDMIAALLDQVERHPQDLELARSAADVRRISRDGRIAALMGLEGGHAIENDLEALREFYDLGVRYMTLTWNNANDWADSCYEHPHEGLTDFGRRVVREMNQLGMMVDVSHVSDATFFETLEVTSAPVMASHSAARALVDQPRNMTDEMLRAVARSGGVVMINFQDIFVDPRKRVPWGALGYAISNLGWPDSPLSSVIDHIAHSVQVAGVDHVGLGSDFAGSIFMPEGMKDVSDFPNVTLELLKRGYSEDAIRKILGENLLRVLAEVEAEAARLTRPPSPRSSPTRRAASRRGSRPGAAARRPDPRRSSRAARTGSGHPAGRSRGSAPRGRPGGLRGSVGSGSP